MHHMKQCIFVWQIKDLGVAKNKKYKWLLLTETDFSI